ncbi:MuDR family transposase, partial [Striga asiatica]
VKSKFLTVGVHYGGNFYIRPNISTYIGGESVIVDYVDFGQVGLDDFVSVAQRGGVKKPMRFYARTGGWFLLLNDDMDLYRIWDEKVGTFRDIHIYVGDMKGQSGGSVNGEDRGEVGDGLVGENDCGVGDGLVGENDCGVGDGLVGEKVNDSDGEGDDDSDELYDSEYDKSEDRIDDRLFSKYVDGEAEWGGCKLKAIADQKGEPHFQYALLWDYCEEIRKTNPGSTVVLDTNQCNGENIFQRFYICLNALKQGFKAGCRPLVGVDGCHLKGPNKGILLTAVGIDPNNALFPLAYAVVNVENRDNWE